MDSLAINGGPPVRQTMLNYGKQSLDDHDIQSVVGVLRGDFLTTGPCIDAFEAAVAAYVGVDYAVAVSSGTAALHMACDAIGLKPGDEVIVSAMTFAASSNAPLYMGATPVFADIDPKTYNVDPADIERKITDKTKALVVVDYMGHPLDMDAINAIAKAHNLYVIEDAAHALGATYKNKKVGTYADLTMFSFHPVKPITTGEGGMMVTNNEALYKRMRKFRTHGITRDPEELDTSHGPWYYEQQLLGFNYRMTDIQAALGLSQLKKLDAFITRRQEIAKIYMDAFKTIEAFETPPVPSDGESGWHLYMIALNVEMLSVDRKTVFKALRNENIGVNVHYLPVYLHPYYQQKGYTPGLCPHSEALYERIITLPLFPAMSDEDVNDVIQAVKKVITHYRK